MELGCFRGGSCAISNGLLPPRVLFDRDPDSWSRLFVRAGSVAVRSRRVDLPRLDRADLGGGAPRGLAVGGRPGKCLSAPANCTAASLEMNIVTNVSSLSLGLD